MKWPIKCCETEVFIHKKAYLRDEAHKFYLHHREEHERNKSDDGSHDTSDDSLVELT